MVRSLSKTETGKICASPKYSLKREKSQKSCRGPEGVRTEEIIYFEKNRREFWGRTLQIECNNKSLWEYIEGQLLKVTNVLYLPLSP